jgi:hypothetical protein
MPSEAPAPVPPARAFKGTIVGGVVAPETIAAARAAMQAEAAAAAAAAPVPGAAPMPMTKGTMIGAAYVAPAAAPAASGVPHLPATAPEVPAARSRTVLGVATPGIAPTGDEVAPYAAAGRVPPGGTVLGVAVPGIAPTAPGEGPPIELAASPVRPKLAHTAVAPAVLPAPGAFVDDTSIPTPPARRERQGVPVAIVASIVGGLVLVGGVLLFVLKPAAAPILGQPRLDAQGNEILHLVCDNCADGTVVTLGSAKATFKAKETDLPLAKPLEVGENNLVLEVDRKGNGRSESVKLAVPLGFYVRADLSDIGATPPLIAVRVAAAPGTDVTVDGKPLSLDATGKGVYKLDVTPDIEGPSGEVRILDKKIPYTVTPKGAAAQSGTVNARIGVTMLRLDEPSLHPVVDGTSFTLAGQTSTGATLTIDGQPATVAADGTFVAAHLAGAGETSVELRAFASGRAPRAIHLIAKKVQSLGAEAKAEESMPLLTYDKIAQDIAAATGLRAVVAGEVVESRVTGHQTIALVNDARGCKRGPCLARVVAPEGVKMARGQGVRAYGTVTQAVTTPNGKTVPEVSADFVVAGAR